MIAEITTRPEVKVSCPLQSEASLSCKASMGTGDKRSYTLTYFDIRGRAETSRMLFALAEVKYKDNRVSYMEWPQLKPKTPFGQLPTLEVLGGGVKPAAVLAASHGIERYLAREFGLAGKNSLDAAKIDMVVETMRDAMAPIAQLFNEKDENKKREAVNVYAEGLLPKFLTFLTDNLSSEWFLDEVSLADASIYVCFENIQMFVPDFLDGKSHWKLREWKQRFECLPMINEWLANRPVTAY